MKKAISDLTAEQKAELEALATLSDDQINTDDIPEVTDWSDAQRGLFYRPVKQKNNIDDPDNFYPINVNNSQQYMSKKLNEEKWLAILGFIFVAAALYMSWLVLSFFTNILSAADPTRAATIIGTMITAFVALVSTILTQRQIKLREIEEAHREKKVEIYQNLIQTIASVIAGQNEQVSIKAPTEQELIDILFKYKSDILLWGSPKVIKSQLEWDQLGSKNEDVFTIVNNLYKAIREDIGLSNSGLNNLELIKLFLKDPDELDRAKIVEKLR